MLLLFIILLDITTSSPLFAGNGIQTTSYSWLDPKVIQTNCTTYDDCYSLLCSYLLQPVYKVTIVVNKRNYGCTSIDPHDQRMLKSLMTIDNITADTTTVSNASLLLCIMYSYNPSLSIDYIPIDCGF